MYFNYFNKFKAYDTVLIVNLISNSMLSVKNRYLIDILKIDIIVIEILGTVVRAGWLT